MSKRSAYKNRMVRASQPRGKTGTRGKSSPDGDLNLDKTSTKRRLHEQVATFTSGFEEDWEDASFNSTRVAHARYSPSRQELHVEWVNGPDGVPYRRYVYDAVPDAVWAEFTLSGSPGRFVGSVLNQYPYRPI